MQMMLPDINSCGDRKAPYRACSCEVERDNCSTTDVAELHLRISKLEDWMDILLHLIPNGQPTQPYFSGVDINQMAYDPNPAAVHHLLWETMKQNCGGVIESEQRKDPKMNLWFNVCLYCGNMRWSRSEPATGFGDPGVFMNEPSTCYACLEIRSKHPHIFEWVSKILLMAYRTANVKVPTPAPVAMKHRNILIDNENPGVAAS